MKLLILVFVSIISCSKDKDDIIIGVEKDKIFRSPVYLQNPATDGMTVMWHTHVPCYSWVEYGTDSLNMQKERTWVGGISIVNNTLNRIRLSGLQPGTRYYYRVCSSEIIFYDAGTKIFGETATSKITNFTTLDNEKKDFTALIFNDIHYNFPLFDKLLKQVNGIFYDIVFFNGDCFDNPETEDEAINAISHYSTGIGADRVPSVYVWGNHEWRGAYAPFLGNLLGMMDDGYTYGAFNVGDTRFVILDCGEDKPDEWQVNHGLTNFTSYRKEQVEFLKKEITSEEFELATKRVLLHHIPIYGRPDPYNLYRNLCAILSEAPFDISLNAHVHGPLNYIAKGADNNNFPVVFGGGNKEENAIVMILRKQGEQMTLTVRNVYGETLLSLEL